MMLEMQLVLVYALSVIIMLVIQSYLATRQHGIKTLLEYREHIALTGIAGRSDRAVKNSIVSLVLVLPAVMALVSIGQSSKGTVLALQIFLFLRILYFIAYLVSFTWVRSGLWWSGTICICYLYVIAISSA
ncbi:MAPEG family protein [Paracoccaceae bacterium]|nr:MAPEG family protein [Paracoccaceae bacterium]